MVIGLGRLEPTEKALYFVDLTFLCKGLKKYAEREWKSDKTRLQWLARAQNVFFSPSQNMLDITDYVNYSWVDTVASFEL